MKLLYFNFSSAPNAFGSGKERRNIRQTFFIFVKNTRRLANCERIFHIKINQALGKTTTRIFGRLFNYRASLKQTSLRRRKVIEICVKNSRSVHFFLELSKRLFFLLKPARHIVNSVDNFRYF